MLQAIIAFILGILGVAFYYKNKGDSAAQNALLGETKGEDKQLSKQQQQVENQIHLVKNEDDSKLTDQERADRWNK